MTILNTDEDATSESGTERMYGLGRVLADFYDALPPGAVITPAIQRQAQEHALAWLQARMPGLVEAPPLTTTAKVNTLEATENTPRAANG